METNIDTAGKYLEAAKINQENFWKRKQIEWKTSFSLWIALASVTSFIFLQVKETLSCPYNWIFLSILIAVYITLIYFHERHLKSIFIANERDMDFIIYYKSKAEWILDPGDLKEPPQRPSWSMMSAKDWMSSTNENNYFKERQRKMRHHYTPLMITVLIAVLSICILAIKIYGQNMK